MSYRHLLVDHATHPMHYPWHCLTASIDETNQDTDKSCNQNHDDDNDDDSDNDGIPTIHSSPWNTTQFASAKAWGRQPLWWQQAFRDDIERSMFPSWQTIIDLVCADSDIDNSFDEELEQEIPSRLIAQTRSGQMDSFELVGFGPFDSSVVLNQQLATTSKKTTSASTLVVNDVDRWIPSLSHWMDDNFGPLIPRWRRDDAQISLANMGGGIGPHVDSYDVFLIQLSGTRTWKVGVDYRVSVKQEFDNLLEACSRRGIRILNVTNLSSSNISTSTVTIQVKPGDCLYLPPRVMHWGTATSDQCITLSVGCRAPSAADLITKLSETIMLDTAATLSLDLIHRRYTEEEEEVENGVDTNKIDNTDPASSYLSSAIKNKMKDLIFQAVQQALDDNNDNNDNMLDRLIGKMVTEPNRFGGDLFSYPVPLDELDQKMRNKLGVLWGDAENTLNQVFDNKMGVLRRAEGVAFAWSCISEKDGSGPTTYRMYAHGRDPIEIETGKEDHTISQQQKQQQQQQQHTMMDRIANGPPLNHEFCEKIGMDISKDGWRNFLLQLVKEGLLYGSNS
jgi:ribosomal protein L16 Arg81 hydroxylase